MSHGSFSSLLVLFHKGVPAIYEVCKTRNNSGVLQCSIACEELATLSGLSSATMTRKTRYKHMYQSTSNFLGASQLISFGLMACSIVFFSAPGRQRGLSTAICSVASSALFHVSHGPSEAFVFELDHLAHRFVISTARGSADEHYVAGGENNLLNLSLWLKTSEHCP